MDKLVLSVIVPTHNRKEILARSLQALFNQSYAKSNYEIIVVDDGSIDGTEEMLKEIIPSSPVILRYFKQEKKGPAAARNIGIRNTRGEYLLFIGDDIVASNNLLQEHLNSHLNQKNVAVLGYTLWDKNLQTTEFMKFLDDYGKIFSYNKIKNKNNCGYEFFFASNISLEKKWFTQDKFDEDFTDSIQEDIELSYRLKQRGLRIIFNQKAIAYHCHRYDENLFLKRSEMIGRATAILWKKHPGLKKKTGPKMILLSILITKSLPLFSVFLKIKKIKYIYWRAQITYHVVKGMKRADI